ncbi:MAG TPA: Nramp family divalent metal transporter [Candidatus Polarisedimenticolaceae bacterium]|nr:Nramp family divalent metal transporter [Candidatus Polarisedimenticolaceae bacterium]
MDSQPAGSLPEVHRSVAIPGAPSFWRRLFAFAGPAYMISVGYMDPGNWATDIEGGSRFGYRLLWVLLMSNLMAVLLQTLSARLGIVTGRDLAQACRDAYPRPVSLALWILCEVAIAACDLAEVLGTAIGLNLLFGVSLTTGVIVTALDVFILLAVQRAGIRKMEGLIFTLILTIGACYVLEVVLAKPEWTPLVHGFLPSLGSKEALYVAIGILGATVMPHNLYLHSALVQTREVPRTPSGARLATRFNLIDSAVALNGAFFVNAAILVLSAATFHRNGIVVTEIQQAHGLLAPLLGTSLASVAFAIALLCAGQSSTITGTLAGQVVMEGFLQFRMRPWLRRLVTRAVAIVPAVVVVAVYGDQGTYRLLILSQVILSLQLPFAVVPLVQFTGDRAWMGSFASGRTVKALAWLSAAVIVGLNGWLVAGELGVTLTGATPWIVKALLVASVLGIVGLLAYVLVAPRARPRATLEEAVPWTSPVPDDHGYRRIAIALAADAGDPAVLTHGISLARSYGAQALIVHVAEGFGARYFGGAADNLETRDDRAYLNRLRDDAAKAGVRAEAVLLYGSPVEELVALVEREKIDLLVMGAHGHGPLGDILFGSTVTPVRHRVSIPVLVVRADKV